MSTCRRISLLVALLASLVSNPAGANDDRAIARRTIDTLGTIPNLTVQVPMVIVGGWGNCPLDFESTALVVALQKQRGKHKVILTEHLDPWGEIGANARHEGKQIVDRLDALKAAGKLMTFSKHFDLVGFSMGGLVVRSLVTQHSDVLGGYQVRNLVTLATPNHGAHPFLTYGDSPLSAPNSPNKCFPNQGVVSYRSTEASRQMAPDSAFLATLNQIAIPSSVAVTTIAGDMVASIPTQVPFDVPSMCEGNCSNHGPSIPVIPALGLLDYVDDWHAQCRAPGNHCKRDTVCPPELAHTQADGVWVCRGSRPGPPVDTTLGSDGFIRVSSVRLNQSEAAQIRSQLVLSGAYHTESTRSSLLRVPNPKPLIYSQNVDAMDPGRVVVGTPLWAPWMFEDTRVVNAILSLGQR